MKRKLKNGGTCRPKAFWGALVGAATNLIGGALNADAQRKAAQQEQAAQAQIQRDINLVNMNSSIANNINNMLAYNRNPYRIAEYKCGGKVRRRLRTGGQVRITDGGVAIPMGNGTFLLQGSSHEQVNESGNTGIGIKVGNKEIEAEGGEVVKKDGKTLKILSNQPIFSGGISPAEAAEFGINPNVVFTAQENAKRKLGINNGISGGRPQARLGASFVGSDYGTLGVNIGSSLLNSFLLNNALKGIRYKSVLPQFYEETPVRLNTNYNIDAELAALERDRQRARTTVAGNTASGNVSVARQNVIDTDAMTERNKLYDTKHNQEIELQAKQAALEAETRARNAAGRMAIGEKQAEILNEDYARNAALRLDRAQNWGNLFTSLGTAGTSFFKAGQQRYEDENALAAAIATAPSGTYDLLTQAGFRSSPRLNRLLGATNARRLLHNMPTVSYGSGLQLNDFFSRNR